MNSRMRICRYPRGGVFEKHVDGQVFLPSMDLISHLTVMAYLNDIPESDGGATRFFNSSLIPLVDDKVMAKVQPEKGLCVIFPQK